MRRQGGGGDSIPNESGNEKQKDEGSGRIAGPVHGGGSTASPHPGARGKQTGMPIDTGDGIVSVHCTACVVLSMCFLFLHKQALGDWAGTALDGASNQ